MCKKDKANNLVIDFTHVYTDDEGIRRAGLGIIDCSDIGETDMYCSMRAYEEIWRRIEPWGIYGIHYIDSGNYHYVSKIFTDHIDEPFSLVLYDHHTDMQEPMAPDMLSCGDWALRVYQQNRNLRQLILVGPDENDIDEIRMRTENTSTNNVGTHRDNISTAGVKGSMTSTPWLLTFSAQELESGEAKDKVASIDRSVPFYLSVDKDVLSRRYAETNWNQGDMALGTLEELLDFFLRNDRILGVDICGECRPDLPLPLYLEAERKNERTNQELYDFIRREIRCKE